MGAFNLGVVNGQFHFLQPPLQLVKGLVRQVAAPDRHSGRFVFGDHHHTAEKLIPSDDLPREI